MTQKSSPIDPVVHEAMPPWPLFSAEEVAAVAQVLMSNRVNYWTGDEARQFEVEFAAAFDSNRAVALANGTVALDVALHALGVRPGDEVIVTPRTFIATVSSIVLAGGKPVFADVDIDSQNITSESIERVLSPHTRGVICVHLAGWPCDMNSIMAMARQRNLFVIEDCAQAHGARYQGRSVGSFGDVGAWSFCQDKIMTTGGEGGMVTTNDQELWSAMWSFKDHGKSWQAVYDRQHAPGFRWVHESIGTNWRLTEMQAAIGRVQLRHLPAWIERRRRNAQILIERLSHLPALRIPLPPPGVKHAYYKFYAFVRPDRLRKEWSRDRILAEVVGRGVPAFQGSCSEVYLEKAFDELGCRPSTRLPVALELGETSMMLLVHPTLSDKDMHRVADVVEEIITLATI